MSTRTAKTKADLEKDKLSAEIIGIKSKTALTNFQLDRLKEEAADEEALDQNNNVYTFDSVVNNISVRQCMHILSFWSRRDPGCDIKIIFDSPGGSVIDGFRLYDYLSELKARGHHITTVGLGMAASMGGILLQAGDTRLIGRHAWILIHEISSGAIGKASEMEDELKFVKRLQKQALDILSRRSSMTAAQIALKWRKTDWWIDAEEAIELGFVDGVNADDAVAKAPSKKAARRPGRAEAA